MDYGNWINGDAMKKKNVLRLLISLLVVCMPFTACTKEPAPGPTAVVIDAETGQPIEGAIALAQWFGAGGGAMFEGGTLVLEKAKETYSDKDGRVYIDGFWVRRQLFLPPPGPRLTVYKPGYVLWDSEEICPFGKRTDFDEQHRTVKLLKFETEAARWLKEGYDKGRGGPHVMQYSCFHSWYDSAAGTKFNGDFMNNFLKHEDFFILKEMKEYKNK